MSTADGANLATSTVAAKNILERHFPRWVPQGSLLQVSRLCAVPVLLCAILIALINPDPGKLLILAFDIVFAGCVVPLVFGLYWRRSTAAAALVSMIVASTTRLVLHFLVPEEYAGLETLIPPVVSCLLFVGISFQVGHRRDNGTRDTPSTTDSNDSRGSR
jgi:Na+/proline symporter